MKVKEFRSKVRNLYILLIVFFGLLIGVSGLLVYAMLNPSLLNSGNTDYIEVGAVENGIHVETGFVYDDGIEAVITSCTPCHSAKLVTQNRATKEGWLGIIRWMQETQNLWDLGKNETIILDYLAKHYAPKEKGRRENLTDIEWYELEN